MGQFDGYHLANEFQKNNEKLRKKISLYQMVLTIILVIILCMGVIGLGHSTTKYMDAKNKYQLYQTSGLKGWVTRRERACIFYGCLVVGASATLGYRRWRDWEKEM